MLPLDLHVLSLPPAFNLSHDQTLQFKGSSVKSTVLLDRLIQPTYIMLKVTTTVLNRLNNILSKLTQLLSLISFTYAAKASRKAPTSIT